MREEHRRTLTKYIMETKKCNRIQARKYFQRFDNVVKERSKLSTTTLDDMSDCYGLVVVRIHYKSLITLSLEVITA